MKTNQELLDFYGVEVGKKYKITESKNRPNYYVGLAFVVKETSEKKVPYVELCAKPETYEPYFNITKLNEFGYEELKELLTDKEKEYLSAVIRPFRDQIVYIAKNFTIFTNSQYIGIYIKDQDTTYLPMFPEGKYYKGMEVNKEYTLEDLGL